MASSGGTGEMPEEGKFRNPFGICLSSDNQFIFISDVVDQKTYINKFRAGDGTFIKRWECGYSAYSIAGYKE